MTKFDFGRTIAAIACTLVASATLVLGAIGPAQAGAGHGAPAMVARTVA